jgi:hypothetical protein
VSFAGLHFIINLGPFEIDHQRRLAPILHLPAKGNPPMCTLQTDIAARKFEKASSITIFRSQSPQQ